MQAVILAAGESSRFWPLNYQQKALFKIMGRPLIYHTIESLKKAGIKDVIIVQNSQKDIEKELSSFSKELSSLNIRYVIQVEAKGMGNAIVQVKDYLEDRFFVLDVGRVDCGDYIKAMLDKQKSSKAELILLGAKTNQPQIYGILELEKDRAKGIIEKPEKGEIKTVGIYLLPKELLEYYQRTEEHMYAFEDALSLYMKEKDVRVVITEKDTFSLKYPWHLFALTKYLLDKNLGNKKVHIGKNVKILEGAIIKGPCYIGDDCIIGNNAVVRDYSNLEEGVMVGAQSEVTRSIFQKNVHVHSGYFGDSIFGENCRAGAGVVTGNVRLDKGEIKSKIKEEKISTGLNSLGVIAGQNSHFGINASLMPGVLVGSSCSIGPGSVVFENIEDKITFFTKFESVKNGKRE